MGAVAKMYTSKRTHSVPQREHILCLKENTYTGTTAMGAVAKMGNAQKRQVVCVLCVV